MTKTSKKFESTSGPLRTRHRYRGALARPLASDESPESKLPALFKELGVSTAHQAVVELAIRHVPGFKSASKPSGKRRLLTQAYEEILIEFVQFRQAFLEAQGLPKQSVLTIMKMLSQMKLQEDEKASPNPFYGLSPHTLHTIFKRRDERQRTFDKKTQEAIDGLTKLLAQKLPY